MSEDRKKGCISWGAWAGAIALVLGAVIAAAAAIYDNSQTIHATETAQAKSMAAALAAIPTAMPATETPVVVCFYQGQNEDETIRYLIQTEAAATNQKNLDVMIKIFMPDAIFRDEVSSNMWVGPVDRYENDLFKNTDFKVVSHFNVSPVGNGINGNMATYVSGSSGYYKPVGTDQWLSFNNPSLTQSPFGSDHWILEKNISGCWAIREFDFNAGNVKFP
jgi:hypothetical protein